MGVRSVLLDEYLLLDLLLNRRSSSGHGELLWDLFVQGRIEGWITDFGFERVWHYTSRLRDEPTADELLRRLTHVLTRCPVKPSTWKAAEQSDLPLPFAIQVAIATQLKLDGIVTNRPFDYSKSMEFDDVQVYTPGHLLADFLRGGLETSPAGWLPQDAYAGKTGRARSVATAGLYLDHVEVSCGNECSVATVKVHTPLGQVYQETAEGVGPVDASFKAINLAIGHFLPMSDLQMVYYKSLATSSDSEVSAMVLLQHRMELFAGRGFHTDIVMASAYAYIDALSYLLYCDRT